MLSLCLLLGLAQTGARRVARDVLTTQGFVRGYRATPPPHFAYFGIPYAEPPTRGHRFESPQPPPRWDGLFEATHRVRCPQQGTGGDENCLVLNIFAPEGASSLPVLVLFHDGGFQKGWGSFEPPKRLLENGILVVTFNYRLGALGFLCLPESGVTGNYGLKDQVAALYWLQKNIAGFGGNPAEVTVYGTEAGAASIEILALSGLTEGLFHKAILESGSAISPNTIRFEPEKTAHDAAPVLELPSKEKFKDIGALYRRAPTAKLMNITLDFLPCIERDSYSRHALMYEDPLEIMKKGNFQQIPVIYAFTNHKANKLQARIKDTNVTDDLISNLIPNNLEFGSEATRMNIEEIIRKLYVDDEENVSWGEVHESIIHDVTTVYPMVKSASLRSHHSSAPVYLMDFSYNRNNENLKDINSFIFSKTLRHPDEIAAERLSTLWSNFIKYGDPTPLTSSHVPVIWPPLQSLNPGGSRLTSLQCLSFSQKLAIRTLKAHSHLAFWDTVYERFYRYGAP